MEFELIKEVDYVFLGEKIVIISKIPIKNEVDSFKLMNLISIPVNINGQFYKAKNVESKIAVGNKYRIKINECRKYKNNQFCKGVSGYRSVVNDTTS